MIPQTKTMEYQLELSGLRPDPIHTWRRLREFLQLDEHAVVQMRHTSEVLLENAAPFVVAAYDYLAQFDETAAVLGWEQEMDEEHLRERRQFFSTWMARTIGVDFSDEFAEYLFHAGRLHAGHGPRQIHTPDLWVMGAMGLVQAYFAERIIQAGFDPELTAGAIGAWNKYLMLQTRQMNEGYKVALALDEGPQTVEVKLYGRLRTLIGREQQTVHVHADSTVADALRKFFDYYPTLRKELFQVRWRTPQNGHDATWATDFETVYVPRSGPYWRILLNGRDLSYDGGFDAMLQPGDVIALFPPGR
ncbi:MAG: hypothetical protein GXP42_01475 [Chloroflexi bacterium]|nr:hypothetical protein [Chloroflexota bacterium]